MVTARKAKPIVRPRKRRATPAPGKASSADLKQQLAEARAQQAATAEVLRVISSSPTETQPVFETIVRSCQRLFGGRAVAFCMPRGDRIETVAFADDGTRGSQTGGFLQPFPLDRGSAAGACILDRRVVNVPDTREAATEFPRMKQRALALGYLSGLFVPLVQADRTLGMIGILRAQPGRFTEREVALAGTFADQAVIAIENARLFNETREALERQTATAEILKVISESPSDTRPAFDAIARSALRLFNGLRVAITLVEAERVRMVATRGTDDGVDDGADRNRLAVNMPLDRESAHGRAIVDCRATNFGDTESPEAPLHVRENGRALGFRAIAAAPMLRGGVGIGALGVTRKEPGEFTPAQIALLQTFADQAAIAIENARMFNETREALEQQTAITEILKVISGSPENVQPVLDAVAKRAAQICEASDARIFLDVGGRALHAAGFGDVPMPFALGETMELDRGTVSGRAIIDAATVHVADMAAASREEFPTGRMLHERSGYRTILAVPLLREGRALGAIMLRRMEVRPFTDRQIALLGTFADQAAIAIENVRLFNETKEALERQTATAEILRVISGSPTDEQPVFDAIVKAAARLFGRIARIRMVEGNLLHLRARSDRPLGGAATDGPLPFSADTLGGRVVLERKALQVADIEMEKYNPLAAVALHQRALGYRAVAMVPLLREDVVVGLISVSSLKPGALSDKEMALLTTFADQAVIAIENARLFNETREALERQTATAEILKVIASSPSDVQPVFDAIAASARRLLDGGAALVARRDGDLLQLAAYTSTNEAADAALKKLWPSPITGKGHMGRAVLSAGPVLVDDIQSDTSYSESFRESARTRGVRSVVSVPMLREGEAVGVISVNRSVAGRFSEHQTDLLKTFADQAVIAIENVRLFNETREALERQTATAEILKVIASSPSDVQPVFDAIVESALVLIGGFSATVTRVVGDQLHLAAFTEPARTMALKSPYPMPIAGTVSGAAVTTRTAVVVTDTETDSRAQVANARARGYRGFVSVPMIRDGEVIGTINVSRKDPGPFADREVALLQTFADQAVIAIENVRLFNETKEALERQTATADILKVISSSPTDVQPVFEAIVDSGMKLFSGAGVGIGIVNGEEVVIEAAAGMGGGGKGFRMPLSRDSASGTAILERKLVNIADTEAPGAPPHARENGRRLGIRSMTQAPMFREGEPIGSIGVMRKEVGGLDDKQLSLLQTFADQAVIAIENVRLFNETREALERQTATADILKIIASSPSDVQPVFDAIAESAKRILGGHSGMVLRFDGEQLHLCTVRSNQAEQMQFMSQYFPVSPVGEPLSGRCVLERLLVETADLLLDPDPRLREIGSGTGVRAVLVVPMLREGMAIGTISVARLTAGAFSEAEKRLLTTFADQAVIAIENVRLFNETREALERQTATSDILKVIAGSPSNVQPVLDAVAERAARLCDAVHANVLLSKHERMHIVADFASEEGPSPNRSISVPLARTSINGRAFLDRTTVHVEDLPAVIEEYPDARENLERFGNRVNLAVPMLCEAGAIGTVYVWRREARPFSRDQTTLLETFAAQAVIAIENVRLFNETKEALERQTATAEVLKVIASSPSDVQPVFDVIAERAVALSGAHDGVVTRFDGQLVHFVAMHKVHPEGAEAIRSAFPCALDRNSAGPQAIRTSQVVHLPDVREIPDYYLSKAVDAGGVCRMLAVPLLREGKAMGAITLAHKEPGYFSDHVVELLKTFADQAVIAIENVRLFNETREALERQTATAEILKVIASSPSDVQPVFDAIVHSAERLFGRRASLRIAEPAGLRLRAQSKGIRAETVKEVMPIDDESLVGQVALFGRAVQFSDLRGPDAPPFARKHAHTWNFRANAGAPLIRDGKTMGVITVTSPEIGAMTEKQMELLATFADQAVIAIENVRLFKELETRTQALTKSVGQLTALGEVGQAISSTLDLETVLQTIVSRAVQLTGMDAGAIYEYDEQAEGYRLKAAERMGPELVEAVRRTPIRKGDGATGLTAVTLEPVQVADIEDESYQGSRKDNLRRTGYRAVLAVPLLREDNLLGALQVFRRTPGAFAPDVVELLKTFATQSAMAIQNARLFREIAEKGRQLEQASQHKSNFLASMSHELRTPLNAILGFNEMILGQVYGEVPSDMQEPLSDIQASGKHLLRLINNVLDLAKIEAGRMELSPQDYSVHDMVGSVHSTLRPLAAEKGLEFLAAVPGDLPLAYGDGGRIAQCLMNLAGNSIKFTKAGKVEIAVQEKDGLLTYRVSDTGIGIPPDKIASLFTEFKQTDATIASEYGGTGLGLSISRKFVEMHGGRIWIESELGKGSTFNIEVPLRVKTS